MTPPAKKRRFDPLGLPPSAGDPSVTAVSSAKTKTSRRRDVQASRRPDVQTPPSSHQRIAYTWRITPAQSDQLDRVTAAVRDAAGLARLDRAQMLAAFLDQAEANPDIASDLAQRLDI